MKWSPDMVAKARSLMTKDGLNADRCSVPCPTSPDFVPWRFSDACCRCLGVAVVMQASEKPSHEPT
jgi:hypothetical protein